MLSSVDRRAGVPVFYSVQTPFDLLTEEAAVWVRVRMKRARVADPGEWLKEKEDPKGREIVEELKPQAQDRVFQKRRPDGFVGTDQRRTHDFNRWGRDRRRRGVEVKVVGFRAPVCLFGFAET
jgi:nicotinamidase-related amidase